MSGLPTCKAVLANWASNCCQSVIRPSQQEIQEYLLMVVCLSDRELRQAQVLQIPDNHEGRTGLLLPTSWRSNLPAHVLLHLHLIFGMALLNFRNLTVGQWPQLHKSFPMSWGNYETSQTITIYIISISIEIPCSNEVRWTCHSPNDLPMHQADPFEELPTSASWGPAHINSEGFTSATGIGMI